MLSPMQREFANFVKEEFGYDIIEVSKEESDTFESIFGADFIGSVYLANEDE